jgi:hypothetical protein
MISHRQDSKVALSLPPGRRQIIGVFLLSLIISAGFWLINSLNEVYHQDRTVHLKFTGVPENKWIGVYPAATFDISISGEGFNLFQVNASKDTLVMNISRMNFIENRGIQNETLSSSELSRLLQGHYGKSISIQKISIDSLTLELEPISERQLYVSSRMRFDLREGYTLAKDPELSISQATLIGPASKIERWDTLYTQQENLGTVEHSSTYKLKISVPRGWRTKPEYVLVALDVEEIVQGEMEIPIISNKKDGIRLIPDQVKVKYSCGLSRLDRVTAEDFNATVDVDQNAGNRLFVNVSSNQPFVKLISYYPTSVDYLIIE